MKLVYISNSRMPSEYAHGLQVMQMCEAFVQNGCDVELIVPKRVNKIKKDPFSYYGIKKSFSIKKLLNLDFIFLNNAGIFFWIQTLTFLLSVKIYLLFKKYNVLYTREQLVGFFFKNFVLEIHSLPKNIKSFHLYIWKKADRLVVLTPFIKKRLIDLGISEDKILVAPDGVDLQRFDLNLPKNEARVRLNLPKDKKLIGYVGAFRTLGMEKGLDVAILAMKALPIDAILVLVGGHLQDIEYYKNLSHKIGVEKKIILIGRVDYKLVPIYLQAFDVLIAPFPETEHYNYYMSPMKIFEYMAAKRPIISTKLPSLVAIIGGGEAFLVAPGSSKDLAEGMAKILQDEPFGQKLIERANEKIKDLTWAKRVQKIIEFIK